MLASKGTVDHGLLTQGYSIGGVADEEMCLKFAQCIEKRLRQKGVNITLVEELNPYDAGSIKVDMLCNHSFKRLW